jgi:hypothetical protein
VWLTACPFLNFHLLVSICFMRCLMAVLTQMFSGYTTNLPLILLVKVDGTFSTMFEYKWTLQFISTCSGVAKIMQVTPVCKSHKRNPSTSVKNNATFGHMENRYWRLLYPLFFVYFILCPLSDYGVCYINNTLCKNESIWISNS